MTKRNEFECLEESIDLLRIVETMVDSCAAAEGGRSGTYSAHSGDSHAPWRGIKRTLVTIRSNLSALRKSQDEGILQAADHLSTSEVFQPGEAAGRSHGVVPDRERTGTQTEDAAAGRNAPPTREVRGPREAGNRPAGGSSLTSRIQMAPTAGHERQSSGERADRNETDDRHSGQDRSQGGDRNAARGSTREIRRPEEPEMDSSATVPA